MRQHPGSAPGGPVRYGVPAATVIGVRAVRLAVLTVVAVILGGVGAAAAHPMGNVTSNTAASLTVRPDGIGIDYVVDLAEIPTFQERARLDADGDGDVGGRDLERYAADRCPELADGLNVTAARPAAVTVRGAEALLAPGQAGLDTLRLTCSLWTEVGIREGVRIEFRDTNFADRLGWREVTAVGAGVTLDAADVPAVSASRNLRDYPTGEVLLVRQATITVGPVAATPVAALPAPAAVTTGFERVSDALTSLIGRERLTPGFAIVALVAAVVLGGAHAVAPGHGKTVMAAYLLSSEGTLRRTLALGATVAVTHTVGVILLGVAITVSQGLAPERVYPWLGLVSGALFAWVGATLWSRARRLPASVHDHAHDDHAHAHAHTHAHAHAHAHAHEPGDGHRGHDHGHGPASGDGRGRGPEPGHGDRDRRSRATTWRTLLLPGLAGGLLPSPSALVVLVAGMTLGRGAYGLALVVAYGVGMAATLLAAGWVLARFRGRVTGWVGDAGPLARLAVRLPQVTAGLVVVGGIVIAFRSAAAVWIG